MAGAQLANVESITTSADEKSPLSMGATQSSAWKEIQDGEHNGTQRSNIELSDRNLDGDADASRSHGTPAGALGETTYKVYKRRWFGLVQLTLLNIIISWDVSAFLLILGHSPVVGPVVWLGKESLRQQIYD